MPIYAFKCPMCGTVEEHLCKTIVKEDGTYPPLFTHCNGIPMERVATAPAGIVVKGQR